MNPIETKKRLLKEIGTEAKRWKADALRQKYAPKPPDGVDEAVEAAKLPSVEDVQDQLQGPESMNALESQAEPNEELADETLDENRKVLSGLDDERIQALLASLKK